MLLRSISLADGDGLPLGVDLLGLPMGTVARDGLREVKGWKGMEGWRASH